MRNIITIAKREFANYFISPLGYVFTGLLLVVANWMFLSDLFVMNQANMSPYWGVLVFLLSLFVPAISMGLIADEKRSGTWETILSLPISESEMVVGKFLGSAFYFLFPIVLSLPITITLFILGTPDPGILAGGYIGVILLGLAYLALGIFMSSINNQAIVGFLGATVLLVINNFLGQASFLMRLPSNLRGIIGSLSLSYRSSKFSSGLIEAGDLFFFLSWIFIFLTLTRISLKARDK
ncbi:MAG: ABC transporter permease [Patescibacteria group bacterium]|jgi:ABC-2 type transport system permease protein